MWMKLQLNNQRPGEFLKIKKELASSDSGVEMNPVAVIADFLHHIKDHLIKNLDDQYGEKLWRTLPMVLVVTVPAVWSDVAKSRTMKAVHEAGFNEDNFWKLGKITTISEPEAAALFTIKSLRGGAQDQELAIGDGVIICDMGGGTVDLISYRVAELQPTIVEEVTVGDGDLCGGSFVDRAFIKWLEEKLGADDFMRIADCAAKDVSYTSMSRKLGRIVSDFVFEAKTGFSGREHNFLRLPAPLSALEDDETRSICDGEISITPEELASMFQFSINRTCALVKEQLEQARWQGNTNVKLIIKFLFLVGGFAESSYAYAQIKAFGEQRGMTVIRPTSAWSAVVRGAALKGLEDKGEITVKNRKCRRFYGTDCSELFVQGVHAERKSYICAYSGRKRATDCMHWLLEKGQDVSSSEATHAKFSLTCHFWPNEQRYIEADLLASDSNDHIENRSSPKVYKVATLEVDLGSVPERCFRRCQSTTSDAIYYDLTISVEISLVSSLEFSVTVDGVRYGSLVANYEV